MKLTTKEKEFIAKWFRSQDVPDYDGYFGRYFIPTDIMIVYRRLFPNDWDAKGSLWESIYTFFRGDKQREK